MTIPCTVGILTFNNENTLKKALDSVLDFAEIVICDGGSTDGTLALAREYNCKIISQDVVFKYPDNRIADFSGVRNQMLQAASYDWFFYLDSDEYISGELSRELLDVIAKKDNDVYVFNVPRKYVLNGEIIDWASTYPNYHMRFFNKRHVKAFIKKVHERIEVLPNEKLGSLKECIFVPHESDVGKLRGKYDYYLKIQLENNNCISLGIWLRILYFHLRSTLGCLVKYGRGIVFLKKNRLPLDLEAVKWENNIRLIYFTMFNVVYNKKL